MCLISFFFQNSFFIFHFSSVLYCPCELVMMLPCALMCLCLCLLMKFFFTWRIFYIFFILFVALA
ncbi:hypothetical protein J3Q64DRAFT_1728747 [Phycomyces blakesleeanus]|uniref:Uncharacterized protein n=1 Tax=Phycomyces blakesleeanus TaxID=4837 RepID=A0ABR3B561_PHYBL